MPRIAKPAFAFVAALLITAATFTETLAVPGTHSRPAIVPALV
jgi:hypothetical protein